MIYRVRRKFLSNLPHNLRCFWELDRFIGGGDAFDIHFLFKEVLEASVANQTMRACYK